MAGVQPLGTQTQVRSDQTVQSMSDPGPDPDPEIEQLRTDLQHARETANGNVAEALDNITDALGDLDAADTEPKQENLDSIRGELARLEADTTGETRRQIDAARAHVRAILEAQLADDQTVSERLDDQ